MRIVEKTKTWSDNWNDVIRCVLFKDEKLKDLMLIPSGTSITQFIEKYFIEDVSPDEIVTDEKVRIAFFDSEGRDSGNCNIKNKYKEFDIYVKKDSLHNATSDRLQKRYRLIADRIKYLLIREYHICNMHFDYEDEYN